MKIKKLIYNNKEYSRINNMALPLLLNNISTMVICLCDQAMVGRTSIAAFASVGLISTTVNSITGVIGSTSIAFNIIGARCKGKNDYNELKNNFTINIFISIIIGLIFFLGTLVFGNILLENLYNIKGDDLLEASEYLNIFSSSLGLNMIIFTFSSYFKIMNRTKNILYGNIVAAVSNLFFDYILIFGHCGFARMGIIGSAIGSIIGLTLNIIVYVVAVRNDRLFKILNNEIISKLKDIFKLSLPIMGQELLESTIFILAINTILSIIGIFEVSVYNLLLAIINIVLMPMYAYSQTAITIIGEDLGAEQLNNVKRTPLRCLFFAFAYYIIFSVILLLFKNYIIPIITNDTKLIVKSISYMPLALMINIFFIPATVYKYSLQGIEDGKWVFLSSVIINLIGVISILLLSEVIHLNLYGVYIGLALNYMILSSAFYYRYKYIMKKQI